MQRVICSAEKVMQSAISPGPVCIQDPEACREDYGRPLPPWTQTPCATPLRQEAAVHHDQNLTPQNQLLPGCSWPYQQGPGPPPDLDSYPTPTPLVCVTLTHITLHIAHPHCTPVLLFALYFPLFFYIFIVYIFVSYILCFLVLMCSTFLMCSTYL